MRGGAGRHSNSRGLIFGREGKSIQSIQSTLTPLPFYHFTTLPLLASYFLVTKQLKLPYRTLTDGHGIINIKRVKKENKVK